MRLDDICTGHCTKEIICGLSLEAYPEELA